MLRIGLGPRPTQGAPHPPQSFTQTPSPVTHKADPQLLPTWGMLKA